MAPLNTLAVMAYNSVLVTGSGTNGQTTDQAAGVQTKCNMAHAFKPAIDSIVGNFKGLALYIAGPVGVVILIAIILVAWRTNHVAALVITLVVVFIAATLLATGFNIMPGAC